MNRWSLSDAKNRFGEVVRRALKQGPQLITKHGEDAVVVMSVGQYERLVGSSNLIPFLRASPLAEALAEGELDIDRGTEGPRDVGAGVRSRP